MAGYFYFMSNRKRGVVYAGVTAHIGPRTDQHKRAESPSFTQRYGVNKLVYVEEFDRIEDAIAREKQIKNWRRDWKIELIEKQNPEWHDLYTTLNNG
jgi:putative endonuclease